MRIMKRKEASDYLGMCSETIGRYERHPHYPLPVHSLNHKTKFYFQEELDEWIKKINAKEVKKYG